MAKRLLLLLQRGPRADALVGALTNEGFVPRVVRKHEEARRQVSSWRPDLVLVDVEADDGGGLEASQALAASDAAPVMIIAPVDAHDDIAGALESGVADYATRPLDGLSLLARIHVLLIRAASSAEEVADPQLRAGPVTLNLVSHEVVLNDRPIHLAPTEYELLKALMMKAGEMCSRKELLRQIWAGRDIRNLATLTVHIQRLRRKLEARPGDRKLIVTVRGGGYLFDPDSDAKHPLEAEIAR